MGLMQPLPRQPYILFNEKTVIIGTAMGNLAVHLRERTAVDVVVAISKKNPADAAHKLKK